MTAIDPPAVASAIVSATVPDWSREAVGLFEWQPSRKLLKTIRDYQRVAGRRALHTQLYRKWAVLRYRFWSVVTGADIPLKTRIGGGLLMPHPNGIVIHPDVVIGPNCLLMQQVTLGFRGEGVPRLGGHVDVGTGAKLLGKITLGDDAVVGACALVIADVAPGTTVFGVPAKPASQAVELAERPAAPVSAG